MQGLVLGQYRLPALALVAIFSTWFIWHQFTIPVETIIAQTAPPPPPPPPVPQQIPEFTVPTRPEPPREKLLILYAYSESDSAKENLRFFVEKGLHNSADFIFVLNGEHNVTQYIPDLPNVRVVERPNTCYDIGGMGEVLRQDSLWKKYDKFITMNASIRGPFTPVWSSDCWTDLFLNRITDSVKLVGLTVNCQPRPHVQSMLFATDQAGMQTLLDPTLALSASENDQFGKSTDPVGMSGCYGDWNAAVHAEVGITGLMASAGYKIDSLMTSFHSESTLEAYCTRNSRFGDLWWDNKYFGGNIHPYESIFYKANRNVDKKLMKAMTEWHLKMRKNSFDTCGSS